MLNYIEGNSIIHKINGTIKLITLLIISVYIFTVESYLILNTILVLTILLFIISEVKPKFYIKLIINSIYFVILTFLLNLLFSDLVYSFMVSYRIFIMLLLTIILALTTKTMEIVYGVTNLLLPLRLFGINTRDISLMVAIALSFMPILKNEYIIVSQAQNAKGYFASARNIKRYCICIFVPYLTGCLKRTDDVSLALQAKGYEN